MPGWGTPSWKGGMLVGNFELNPLRRPNWVWPNLFLTPKSDYMNRVNETNNFIIFLRVQPLKRPLQLNIMAFCPEHPKRDQNLKFTPLSETTRIPAPFIWESSPPHPPGMNVVTRSLTVTAPQEGRRDPGKKWRIKKESAQNVLKRKFYRCLIASRVCTWTNPRSGSCLPSA